MRFVLTMVALACSLLVHSQEVTLDSLRKIGLPVVVVETINGEEPSCEYLTPDEGFPGYSIRNATKVPGSVQVIVGEKTIYDSGLYHEGMSGMTIKLRGNNSAFTPKKPYKIKLQKKADMLGEDEMYKDKDWVLLKDETPSLNLMVGLKVNELVGLQWTPRFRFVNLMMNGDYRGVYMLCESVKRNTNCRLNVSETGFIFEFDPYWWNEELWFKSNMSNRRYTFKYPDSEDVTPEQLDYLVDFMTKVDYSPYNGTYEEYIDMKSFASWVLGHDILGTYDWYGSNMYMTKNDTLDSKLMMANMWDFDTIEMVSDNYSMAHTTTSGPFFNPLFNSPDSTFTEAYRKRWEELSPTLFDEMEQFLYDFAVSDEAAALEKSRELDFNHWEDTGPTVEENIESNLQWFRSRKAWLNDTIQKEIAMGISMPSIHKTATSQGRYNLHGQRVPKDAKGIIVEKGRKYIQPNLP